MTDIKRTRAKTLTAGDAAVDGLMGGVVGGIVMALYLVVVGLAMGTSPVVMLSRFDPSQAGSPVVGGVMHLAVAGVYGVVYGLGWLVIVRGWLRSAPAWLVGLAYGIALAAVAAFVVTRTDSPLREIPLTHFMLSHLVYGVTLGWVFGKNVHQPL